VLFDGCDLLKLSEEEMREVRGRDIGMIFQEPMTSLNPVLTGRLFLDMERIPGLVSVDRLPQQH
jgi:ABC-type microcin C transport system duplicated ATPase subunit YejF